MMVKWVNFGIFVLEMMARWGWFQQGFMVFALSYLQDKILKISTNIKAGCNMRLMTGMVSMFDGYFLFLGYTGRPYVWMHPHFIATWTGKANDSPKGLVLPFPRFPWEKPCKLLEKQCFQIMFLIFLRDNIEKKEIRTIFLQWNEKKGIMAAPLQIQAGMACFCLLLIFPFLLLQVRLYYKYNSKAYQGLNASVVVFL